MDGLARRRCCMRTLAALGWIAVSTLAAGGNKKLGPQFVAVQQQFHQVYRRGSPELIAKSLQDVAMAAVAAKDNRTKQAARPTLRRCLKHRSPTVRIAAVHLYGLLALKGSSRDLRSLVDPRRNQRQPHAIKLAAIAAWGSVHDSGTHKVLLRYIRVPSRHRDRLELAQAAVRALAAYRPPKGRRRYELLRDFMQAFDHIYGAAIGVIYPSAAATEWWGALAPEMVQTFNVLTVLKLRFHSECWRWWKRNHRRVKAGKT